MSGGSDQTLHVWDWRAGVAKRIVRLNKDAGVTDSVSSLKVTTDGRIVSGWRDGTLQIWEDTCKTIVLKSRSTCVESFAATTDARLIAICGSLAPLEVWDSESQSRRELRLSAVSDFCYTQCSETKRDFHDRWNLKPAELVHAVAFSSDDRRLVAGCEDNAIRIFDVQSAKLITVFRGHTSRIKSVAFSNDGNLVVSGGGMDKTVRIWDTTCPSASRSPHQHEADIRCLDVLPQHNLIVTGSDDRTVRLWNAETGVQTAVLKGHKAEIHDVVVHDRDTVMSVGSDATRCLWDVQTGELKCEIRSALPLEPHPQKMDAIARAGSGDVLLSESTLQRPALALRRESGSLNTIIAQSSKQSVAYIPTSLIGTKFFQELSIIAAIDGPELILLKLEGFETLLYDSSVPA